MHIKVPRGTKIELKLDHRAGNAISKTRGGHDEIDENQNEVKENLFEGKRKPSSQN